jgi:hypothetical protein
MDCPLGLGAWYVFRVDVVPGSIPGADLFCTFGGTFYFAPPWFLLTSNSLFSIGAYIKEVLHCQTYQEML